jgi:hypothetical protein
MSTTATLSLPCASPKLHGKGFDVRRFLCRAPTPSTVRAVFAVRLTALPCALQLCRVPTLEEQVTVKGGSWDNGPTRMQGGIKMQVLGMILITREAGVMQLQLLTRELQNQQIKEILLKIMCLNTVSTCGLPC